MFRKMRRANQQLNPDLCMEILKNTTSGVLSLLGDEGYPYGVPLNHVVMDGRLYFHCAMEGHKADAIRGYDRASYCAIDADAVDAEALSTRFRSVIAFGRVRMVEDADLKRRVLMTVGERFAPGNMPKVLREIDEMLHRTGIIELTMEHITGKESSALARERRERERA